MQDCEKYREQLSALVDGELQEAEAAELNAHLETCADCQAALKLLRALHGALQEELPDPPPMLRSGIRYKIGLEQRRKRVLFGGFGKWTVVAAACCLVVLGAARLGAGSAKTANSSAPMQAVTSTGAASGGTGGADYYETDGAANGNDYTYRTEFTTEATTGAVSGAGGAPAPMPETGGDSLTTPESVGASGADVAPDEMKAPSDSVYNAFSLPGYAAAMAALDSDNSYAAVGILYDLPEGYPQRDWEALPAPNGQKRWLLPRDAAEKLAEEGLFDELYFGDLLAENSLVIQLSE